MELTNQLNDLFAEQLSGSVQWRVIPGQLSKIATSPSGYTWGVNTVNDVFMRKETDQWMKQQRPTEGVVLDLTTDSQRVYIVVQEGTEPQLRSKSVQGDGGWSDPVPVPAGFRTLVATSSQLVADTSRGMFTCASPCTNPSWVSSQPRQTILTGSSHTLEGTVGSPVLQGSTSSYVLNAIFAPTRQIKVTSASARYVYGVDSDGKAHVYRNGEWTAIPGFASKSLAYVSGEVDDTALYGTETTGRLWRCKGQCASDADLEAIGSDGMGPDTKTLKQFAVDGSRQELWQLTPVRGGDYGNGILSRSEHVPDVLAKTGPLNAQRDLEVDQIVHAYENANADATAGARIQNATTFLQGLETRRGPNDDERILRRQVDMSFGIGPSLFLLQIAAGTVLVVALIYVALPEPVSHAVAFVVACIGLAISFSASRGNGKS